MSTLTENETTPTKFQTTSAHICIFGPGLVGHVIYREKHVTDVVVCSGYCSLQGQCVSFNYSPLEETCELSNVTRAVRPAGARGQFQYYESVPLNTFYNP